MSNGGKGDSSRPLSVPWEQYASDFERIFGKPKQACKCSMTIKLLGDGCSVCNPEMAARIAENNKRNDDDGPGQEGEDKQ